MKRLLTAAVVLALAAAVPAFAGDGPGCYGHGKASKTTSAAWAGAWLQKSASGTFTVAEVAKGSPAARSGLRAGDVVLAVNGYDLSDSEDRATCSSKASCNVGSSVTYTVQRGGAKKAVKVKLEKMPSSATQRFASRSATFDPMLAAVVMPAAL